jgi:Zn-dependent peptidase ImmA (M78 family)
MNASPITIIRRVRELTPPRPLEHYEAQSVAERQATLLLELLGITEPAVDVSLIAELPRVEVRVEPGMPFSGFAHWERGRWVIAINGDEYITRRRFSLAHEFKHVLDHPYIDLLYPDGNRRKPQPSKQRAEGMCDYFAGCLLVPRRMLKRAWASGNQDQRRLAALFNVSPAAMAVRLQQVGLVGPKTRCELPEDSEQQPTCDATSARPR